MKLKLEELMEYQNQFDANNTEITSGFEMVRHTTLHLSKLLGKIAEYCETREHSDTSRYSDMNKVKNEVIPDLLVYALQLSREFDINLEEAYFQRLQGNQGKVNFIADESSV